MKKIFIALLLVVTLALIGCTQPAVEQKPSFPTKPITFIIGWGVGGGSDLVSRVLCAEAEKSLGQPITIINMPGGSGATAYMELANSEPDGYTLAVCTGTISTLKPLGNITVGGADFEPVITINSDPGALWVKADAPWQTLEEFVEAARANPDTITVVSSNPGSITRFGTEVLENVADVQFRIVSDPEGEAGGPEMVAGGHVNACQAAPVTASALYEAGLIRPLGVMSPERVPAFPEIPTYMEQGYDCVMSNYRQVLAPKGIPQEVIDILYAAFKEAANSDTYVDYMNDSGSTPLDWDPAATKEFLAQQDAEFLALIEAAAGK